MTEKVRVMIATYKNIKISQSEARKVRGFFADLDEADSNLHNHLFDGTDVYRYPKIQYKVLNGKPTIIAFEEGIRSIHRHLMEEKTLRIGNKTFSNVKLDIKLSELLIGDSKQIREYRFETPWLALNQNNVVRYYEADKEEKEAILSKILIGNVLSMCKGMGITVEGKLQAFHQLKSVSVYYKGRRMEAFTGSFQINCCIPDLFGIGKGTSRGFGTVKIERKQEEV